MRRKGWRSPLYGRGSELTDHELEMQTVWGIEPFRPKVEVKSSGVPDLRPHIYEGMMDDHAREVLARVHNGIAPLGSSNGRRTGNGKVENPHDPLEEELLAALDEIAESDKTRSEND